MAMPLAKVETGAGCQTFGQLLDYLVSTTDSKVNLINLNYPELKQILSELLKEYKVKIDTITALRLSRSGSLTGIGLLITAINQNPHIRSIEALEAENCGLTDSCAVDIAHLEKPVGLLNLSVNPIGAPGATALIQRLCKDGSMLFKSLGLLNMMPTDKPCTPRVLCKATHYDSLAEIYFDFFRCEPTVFSHRGPATEATRAASTSRIATVLARNYGTMSATNPMRTALSKDVARPAVFYTGGPAQEMTNFMVQNGKTHGSKKVPELDYDDVAPTCCGCW